MELSPRYVVNIGKIVEDVQTVVESLVNIIFIVTLVSSKLKVFSLQDVKRSSSKIKF